MTTQANRIERQVEHITGDLVYLRREHPGVTPELVIVNEGLECYVRLDEEQFRKLVRDATGMYFTKTMQP